MGHLLLEEGAGTIGKISWGEKWWRKGMLWPQWLEGHVWPAQQLNIEESIDWGLEENRVRKGRRKAVFFSGCLLFGIRCCVHIQRGKMGILPLLAQMDGRMVPQPAAQPKNKKFDFTHCGESPKMALRRTVLWTGWEEEVWEPWAGSRVPE